MGRVVIYEDCECCDTLPINCETLCVSTPLSVELTIAGITDPGGGCATCPDMNAVFTLPYKNTVSSFAYGSCGLVPPAGFATCAHWRHHPSGSLVYLTGSGVCTLSYQADAVLWYDGTNLRLHARIHFHDTAVNINDITLVAGATIAPTLGDTCLDASVTLTPAPTCYTSTTTGDYACDYSGLTMTVGPA